MTLEFKHDPRGDRVPGKVQTFIDFVLIVLFIFGVLAVLIYLGK